MRGNEEQQDAVFSYVSLEQRVPADHPLRAIRKMVDEGLKELSPQLERLYSSTGRPSIAPEKLLRALLLQALYGKRSERLLMEELDYSLLFRWFVGLAMDDEVWDATVFSKNRERLLEGEIASRFFAAVRGQLERSGLLSDEHFTVDGTMLEAWANRRSFREKAEPPQRGSGYGGKRLLRDTHESRSDPEARLFRKCNAGAAEPCYLGHVLAENQHGLIIGACVTEAGTRAEREAALVLLDQVATGKRRTLGADKQYQEPRFVSALRERDIVPHVAEYERGNLQRNSLRAEERNSAGFLHSQRKRKLVEQSFAWIKHWAGLRQVKLRSRRRVEWLFQIAATAYNLVRMRRLLAGTS
ncbi:MAG TPA: IS5 family transposase [Terriglobales bacterium]|jgi:transposase